MLTAGILFVIILASIILACTVLRLQTGGLGIEMQNPKISQVTKFKSILRTAPFLAWAEHREKIAWVNRAVKNTNSPVAKLGSAVFAFHDPNPKQYQPRLGILQDGEKPSESYNVFNYKLDDLEYYFAFAKGDDAKLEKNRNHFIQTLGATFADLQIGIAVFDHENKLSLFNPALSQHLGLRPEWLLKNPNLPRFLDRLRDTQILPEPKDYISWRKVFLRIERSAMKDDYREIWNLPDGRALRVVGRPHLSGTVVFLFEDITNALAMERTFRSKISNLENIMHTATIGFTVFDRQGNTIFLNEVMKQALGKLNAFKTTKGFSKAMQELFLPSPAWGDFRQFAEDTTERNLWQVEIQTISGDWVLINFVPIPNGNTLCEFHFPQKINQGKNVGLACAAL